MPGIMTALSAVVRKRLLWKMLMLYAMLFISSRIPHRTCKGAETRLCISEVRSGMMNGRMTGIFE
jgi:hypothetical protein